MIETLLYFTLGFLCASFLAALVIPAVWRRAVMLTRRRIEASVPLTLDEIRADRDSLKAAFAVETRRLEMELKEARDGLSQHAVNLARRREEGETIAAEREKIKSELARNENEARGLRDEIRRKDDALQAVSSALTRAEEMLKVQKAEFVRLGRQYEESSLAASARQVELVARESEVDRLNSDIVALKSRHNSLHKATREPERQIQAARRAVAAQGDRVSGLEAKLQQLTTDLADREELIDRRDRELARLRERLTVAAAANNEAEDADLHIVELQGANMRLESEIAALTERLNGTSGGLGGEDGQRGEAHMALVMRENKQLRAQLTANAAGGSAGESKADLRAAMRDLAAQVVVLSAALEAPDGPIHQALEKPDPREGSGTPSLADRIRSLRSAVEASTPAPDLM